MQEMQDANYNSSPTTTPATIENRQEDVLRIAATKHQQCNDWVAFFRDILGVEGIIQRVYSTPADRAKFEETQEHKQIQQMLADLRSRKSSKEAENREATRVITVRMPQSLHASLRMEAHAKNTSMNKLCISKLVQMVDAKLVPSD